MVKSDISKPHTDWVLTVVYTLVELWTSRFLYINKKCLKRLGDENFDIEKLGRRE